MNHQDISVYMVLVCYDKAYLVFSGNFDQNAKLLVRGVLVALIDHLNVLLFLCCMLFLHFYRNAQSNIYRNNEKAKVMIY